MIGITIRPARSDEADSLSALCLRSKAHWGYDAAFMALSQDALTISPELIGTGRVLVAEKDGALLGMASLAPLRAGVWDLLHMFVEPGAIGSGAGRALFAAIADMARGFGGTLLSIQADPHAEAFYFKMGAVRVGEAASESVPGRMLPMLDYDLQRPQL